MTLGDLTTRLQTLCHDGWTNHEVGIQIMDAFYKTNDVLKVSVGDDSDSDRIYFVIEAGVN